MGWILHPPPHDPSNGIIPPASRTQHSHALPVSVSCYNWAAVFAHSHTDQPGDDPVRKGALTVHLEGGLESPQGSGDAGGGS